MIYCITPMHTAKISLKLFIFPTKLDFSFYSKWMIFYVLYLIVKITVYLLLTRLWPDFTTSNTVGATHPLQAPGFTPLFYNEVHVAHLFSFFVCCIFLLLVFVLHLMPDVACVYNVVYIKRNLGHFMLWLLPALVHLIYIWKRITHGLFLSQPS